MRSEAGGAVMVLLTQIPHPRYAQAFADYLRTQDISVRLHPASGRVDLFLEDENQWARAQAELARFLAEPDHERYRRASWELGEPAPATEAMAPYYQGQSVLKNLRATGALTQLVTVLCVVAYVYTGQGADRLARAPLMFFADVTTLGDWDQLWRWLSPAFVHFGLMHLAFNLFSWWVFAGMIERVQTWRRLLGLFLVCAVVSHWLEFFWSRNHFGGLSGVVYGLLGYLWFYGRYRPQTSLRLPSGMVAVMLVGLMAGFLDLIPTANMAHLGGLLSGCFLGMLGAKLDQQDQRPS